MGFFKEFKDDLSQAVTELIPEGEDILLDDDVIVNTLEEDNQEDTIIGMGEDHSLKENLEDNYNDNVDQDLLKELFDEKDDEENHSDYIDSTSLDSYDEAALYEEELQENIQEETILTENDSAKNTADEVKSEVTVITKGTRIEGSITSDGSLEVMGVIHGDIDCLGKLSIIGEVTGNSIASEVYVNTSRLEGSINSEGSVKISSGTVVVGDVSASSGVIAGAVKGEIDINGPVIVDSNAIIKGNIKAKSVQINNGAIIDGFCSLTYSDVDIDSVFEK